jgi:hypothetical protein
MPPYVEAGDELRHPAAVPGVLGGKSRHHQTLFHVDLHLEHMMTRLPSATAPPSMPLSAAVTPARLRARPEGPSASPFAARVALYIAPATHTTATAPTQTPIPIAVSTCATSGFLGSGQHGHGEHTAIIVLQCAHTERILRHWSSRSSPVSRRHAATVVATAKICHGQ